MSNYKRQESANDAGVQNPYSVDGSRGARLPDRKHRRAAAPPRVPAGVLFFDSQHLGVSALIMVSLDPGNPKRYDQRIGDRLACDTSKPSPLGTESNGGAITRVFCDTSLLFGDIWLAFAVAKSADASYQDFCRQVQQLTKDADVAALVRGSLEGSKACTFCFRRSAKLTGEVRRSP
jgi:hypothetical protein